MNQQREIEKVRRAIEDRGDYLFYIYRQMKTEGIKNYREILGRAISAWGRSKATGFCLTRPCQFIERLEKGNLPEIYDRHVMESGDALALMEMNYCSLVEAWKKSGATSEELHELCDIASEGDYSSVGENLCLSFDERIADGDCRCMMRIVPKHSVGI